MIVALWLLLVLPLSALASPVGTWEEVGYMEPAYGTMEFREDGTLTGSIGHDFFDELIVEFGEIADAAGIEPFEEV